MTLSLPKDLPENASRAARLVAAGEVDVRPLFPTTRLLLASAFDAERLRDDADAEREAARVEAAKIVDAAQAEAAKIEREANDAAEAIRAVAFEQGRAEGAARLAGVVAALEGEVRQLRAVYPEDVARKAIEWATLIVGAELEAAPSLIVPFLERMIAKVRHRSGVTLRLHPDDAALLNAAMDDVRERLGLAEPPRVVADPARPRHSVHVETSDRAFYDDTLEDRAEKLRGHVERELKKKRRRS